MKYISFFSLLVLLAIVSCKRPSEKLTTDPGAKLTLSTDSLLFDTLLSTVRSMTGRLIVTNKNKNAVKISSIQLGGMANSNYKVIVNGIEGFYTSDIELDGGDSIYILVTVKITARAVDTPFLVVDSLIFNTNNNIQKVQLVAYGQDANFFNGDYTLSCTGTTVWDDPKPYVILKSLTVPAGCILNIKKGVRVFSHNNAVIKINGTLIVEGEKDSTNIVRFEGDQFGQSFEDIPGQWKGIIFGADSKNNLIQFATIKNAITGIEMSKEASFDSIPELTIKNTIIKNMSLDGIEATGSEVYGENCLIFNCVNNAVAGLGGGNYTFFHCTFTGYSFDFFRDGDVVQFSDIGINDDLTTFSGKTSADIENSIIWGDNDEELDIDNASRFEASYSIIRTKEKLASSNFLNVDPQFVSPKLSNFHPDSLLTYNKGKVLPIMDDLTGASRNNTFTLGAYK